jgi:predicted DsbA family dithiol-disulfide isomerase
VPVLLDVARDLGLDADRIAAELESGTWRERVARDLSSAAESGATGTPTFFVNGLVHQGAYDASSLVEALREPAS